MNELGWAEMPPKTLKPPRWIAPMRSPLVPHIYYKDGYWRVTKVHSSRMHVIRLYNLAHQYIARLNRGTPS